VELKTGSVPTPIAQYMRSGSSHAQPPRQVQRRPTILLTLSPAAIARRHAQTPRATILLTLHRPTVRIALQSERATAEQLCSMDVQETASVRHGNLRMFLRVVLRGLIASQ
jgi:hypothetical protein